MRKLRNPSITLKARILPFLIALSTCCTGLASELIWARPTPITSIPSDGKLYQAGQMWENSTGQILYVKRVQAILGADDPDKLYSYGAVRRVRPGETDAQHLYLSYWAGYDNDILGDLNQVYSPDFIQLNPGDCLETVVGLAGSNHAKIAVYIWYSLAP